MRYLIKELSEVCCLDNKFWGNKAACLAKAKRVGLPVLDGFCVFVEQGEIDHTDICFAAELGEHFQRLKERTGANRFIARSSAQFEDGQKHSFPGIYQSKENISNFAELIEAIEFCYASFCSNVAQVYMENMGLQEEGKFCVLIQEQIEPTYSGVVFSTLSVIGNHEGEGYYIELSAGHCREMLQGKSKASAYIVVGAQIYTLSGEKHTENNELQEILGALSKLIDTVMEHFDHPLDVEWGYYNGKLLLFQIRSITKARLSSKQENNWKGDRGLKADAMEKFCQMGLFQKKVIIIGPYKNLDYIEDYINTVVTFSGPITIRYSYGQDLGLPRYFAADKEDAIRFVKQTYEKNWTLILYESISVADSYELCFDGERSVLERVPGMWETDSKIETDLWIYNGKKITAFTANSARNAKFEDSTGVYYKMVAPYSQEEVMSTAALVFPYIEKLRENWPIKRGTNFHFVIDDEKRFYFLNHRDLSQCPDCVECNGHLTVIEGKKDFASWQGGDILLKIDLKRGEEMMLKELVPFLKNTGAKIYIQFGILSHPAILLREMGIDVYPEYSIHKKHSFELCD